MRFEVLAARNIQIIVLWNVMPCSLVDRYNVSQASGTSMFYHENRDSSFLRNVGYACAKLHDVTFQKTVWRSDVHYQTKEDGMNGKCSMHF
jgi:hypothetical protein